MKILFYDTETTGLPAFDDPADSVSQPHLVQIAAALIDTDTGADLGSMNVTLQPNGWRMEAEAQAVHGISEDLCRAVGVSEGTALRLFLELWERCDLRVGHVQSFDAFAVSCAMARWGIDARAWEAGPSSCTKRMAKELFSDLSQIGGGSLKSLHRYFVGYDFSSAHTAEADMRATFRLWSVLQRELATRSESVGTGVDAGAALSEPAVQ